MARNSYFNGYDEHGEYRNNVATLYPNTHPAHFRAAVRLHLNRLRAHEGNNQPLDPETQRYLIEARNILTKEEAMEIAKAEVQDSYFKLQGQRNRAHLVIRHLAAVIGKLIDPFNNDLTDAQRQAAIHASAIMASGPAILDEVLRQYMAASADRTLQRASGVE